MKIKSVILKAFNGHAEGETIQLKEKNFKELAAKGYVEKAKTTTRKKKEKDSE